MTLNKDGKKAYDDLFYVKDHQIDFVFLIDASTSMNDRIKVKTENGIKMFKKIDIVNDMLKKITTLHDCNVMPGTEGYGFTSVKTPPIDHVNKVPPWGTNADGTSMSQEDLESMPIGYLRRFNIKIESQKLNIGVVKISSKEDVEIISSIMNYPDCFNRYHLYEKVKNGVGSSKGKNYLEATLLALYDMFFGPRSKQVLKRFLFFIGDGYAPNDQHAIDICNWLRPENSLSVRRPLDIDLAAQDILIKGEKRPKRYNGANKSGWYQQPCSTAVFFAGVGSQSKGVSRKAKEYAFDYIQRPMNPMGYLNISDGSSSDQFNRILGIVNFVENVSYDNGYENVFSLTLHNCGPHEVTLLNTVVNFENDTDDTPEDERTIPYVGATKYTTEFLKSGIPRGNNIFDIQTLSPNEDGSLSYGRVVAGIEDDSTLILDRGNEEDLGLAFEATADDDPDDIIGGRNNNFIAGRGGQFYGDPNNQDLFENINSNYNILWQSFNTKYEVYRRGKLYNIGNGWASNWRESQGVKNDGVAFKGMPVRVFKSESTGFEIIDYNIGNATKENGYMGDYSHLPVIERGGEIDLFFGVRVGESLDASKNLIEYDSLLEKVQLFINSEDKTLNKMACFANVDFNLICPIFRPSKNTNDQGYDLFVPFDSNAIIGTPVEEVDTGRVDMPMEGSWEIAFDDGAYLHNSAKIRIDIASQGQSIEIFEEVNEERKFSGYDESKIKTKTVAEINFDLADFDQTGLVNAFTDTFTDPVTSQSAPLHASSRAARDAYASPVGVTPAVVKKYAGTSILYNNTSKELYVFVGALSAQSGATPPPPAFKVGGTPMFYSAGGQNIMVPDVSYSALQFIFKIDPETEDTASGQGNDVKKAMASGGHGTFFLSQGSWADLVDPTVLPSEEDPAAGTNWNGTNSKPVTITKL